MYFVAYLIIGVIVSLVYRATRSPFEPKNPPRFYFIAFPEIFLAVVLIWPITLLAMIIERCRNSKSAGSPVENGS